MLTYSIDAEVNEPPSKKVRHDMQVSVVPRLANEQEITDMHHTQTPPLAASQNHRNPLPLLPLSPDISMTDDDKVNASIANFINAKLVPEIQDFLNKPHLPTWVPPESVDDETREFFVNWESHVLTAHQVSCCTDLVLFPTGMQRDSSGVKTISEIFLVTRDIDIDTSLVVSFVTRQDPTRPAFSSKAFVSTGDSTSL
jgi:hypothetical protein